MASKKNVPIEQADVWDVIDWGIVEKLSTEIISPNPRDPRNALPQVAKELIEAGARSDEEAEQVLHRIATPWIGYGTPAVRRQKAGRLAVAFGADPERFIDYLAFKWGLFKRA